MISDDQVTTDRPTYHRLAPDQLAALAAATGDVAAIAELNASRVSVHKLLLVDVLRKWSWPLGERDTAVSFLDTAKAADPRAFDRLIADPMVGAWLSRTGQGIPRQGEFWQLGNLATAAAVRTGVDCQVTGWAYEGRLALPTLGTAVLDERWTGPVRVSVSDGSTTVTGPSGVPVELVEGRHWCPLRVLRARHEDLECAVRLEDDSPYRNGYHAPPSHRLDDDQARHWQEHFAGAWSLLCQHVPEKAAEIAVGLRAVVPLADSGDGSSRSATARESVGAMGASRPVSPEGFAVTLVHEFAHSKLSAVIDIVQLCRLDGVERHHAPWKVEKRPTSALLQGVFAFLHVADTWHRLIADTNLSDIADAQFTDLCEQVRIGYRALAASRELTVTGAKFVATMGSMLQRLLDAPKPARAGRA